jgi:hypothetical protein
VTLIRHTQMVTEDPRSRHQQRVWGWLAVIVTVVIAVVYLLIAKPWSTYDGKKPNLKTHTSAAQPAWR